MSVTVAVMMWGMGPQNVYAGAYLDRRAEERELEGWFEAALGDHDTVFVVMNGTRVLVRGDEGLQGVNFLRADDPRVATSNPTGGVLLGWYEGRRCVLIEAPGEEVASGDESFVELRPLASRLPEKDAGLLAYARALAIWRANHRFCGRCGAPLRPTRAGHVLHCETCGHHSFPRIDPAIIVLVTDGTRALLGRQAGWAAGRYSTIAGFVEPGESIEDAVVREVREETAIEVRSVGYHSSQPWPFPSSLMLGFEALADPDEPHARDGELEDVRWFSRADIRSGRVGLPPSESISRRLIDGWLAER